MEHHRYRNFYHQFITASKLIESGYAWGFALVIIGAFTLLMFAILGGHTLFFFVGLLVVVVSLILIFVGNIGLITFSFRMNDLFKTSLFIAIGLLFIVGLFLTIAIFVAWILMYIALTDIIRELRIQIKSMEERTT